LGFSLEVAAWLLDLLVNEASTCLPLLLERYERDRPDAVCYDIMSLTGPLLAAELDVPVVQLVPHFASNQHYSYLGGFDQTHPTLAAALARHHAFLRATGVTRPIGGLFTPIAEKLNLVFLPKEFQCAGETFDERFVFIGPSLGVTRQSDEWRSPEHSDRLLFVSLGRMMSPSLLRACIAAFENSEWQVAIALGGQIDPDVIGEVPTNAAVRRYFPRPAVLRHATVFLSHAGTSATMESLLLGVPIVAVPQMADEVANARRIEELGLGRRLTDFTLAGLRSAVSGVAGNPAIRTNVADMARAISKSGGAPAGAHAVEALLA
jgi:MGT family glycosyltransferase